MLDYRVGSCQICFECKGTIIRRMDIIIGNYIGCMRFERFESINNSSWVCNHRANELSNFKLDNIFTNHILDKLWNESINNETKKSE